jgi:hypothetical protein
MAIQSGRTVEEFDQEYYAKLEALRQAHTREER